MLRNQLKKYVGAVQALQRGEPSSTDNGGGEFGAGGASGASGDGRYSSSGSDVGDAGVEQVVTSLINHVTAYLWSCCKLSLKLFEVHLKRRRVYKERIY